MQSEKLLPCPFCGGEPQSKTVAIPDGQTLSCRNLKCMAGVAAFDPDAAAKCIAAWNTRAPADLRSALEAETIYERLQKAWDSQDDLPPIIFTEEEAVALYAALAPTKGDVS